MKKMLKLTTVCMILFSFIRCSTQPPKDGITFYLDQIGTIYVNSSKPVVLDVKRVHTEYKYVWMGIKEIGYQTQSVNIEHLTTGDNIHHVIVYFDLPSGIASGNYTLYARMGKVEYANSSAIKADCEDQCVYVEGDVNPPSPISVDLEFVTDFPINYKIKDQYLFPISLRTRVRGTPPGGVWARVYLEVTTPPSNEVFESNYYSYFINDDFHWENITLEFGGGSYLWDGDMPITARVKLYDNWPGGNQITHRTFTNQYLNKVLAPATMPTLEQIDIEYDQQIGQDLFDGILYLDGTIGKSDFIDAAFAPALFNMAFHKDANEQSLTKETIDTGIPGQALNYINTHHSNTNYRYVCAVEEILNSVGNEVFGVTVGYTSGENLGILLNYTKHASVNEPYTGANLEGLENKYLRIPLFMN